jgi:hypothetical protein
MKFAVAANRELTPDKIASIEYFYKPFSKAFTFLMIYLPMLLALVIGGASGHFFPVIITGACVVVIGFLLRKRSIRAKITRAKYIYQFGEEQQIQLQGIGSDYSVKVNGAPRQLIQFLKNGEPEVIKTFNPKIIAAFSISPVQAAYVHPEYPDVILPSAVFLMKPADAARVKRRRVSV